MNKGLLLASSVRVFLLAPCVWSQQPNSCADLSSFKAPGVEITKAAAVPAGSTTPIPYTTPPKSLVLPAYCRVEGVINRRTGVGGEEFGIDFALAMPDAWNGDFMMQGGGGGNGVVLSRLARLARATSRR